MQVGLFLLTSAVITTADLLYFGLLRLYHYHTGLLTHPQDIYLGEVIAEVIAVPALYSVAATFDLPARWYAGMGIGAFFVLVEFLFLRWGAFVHNGWELWHSILLFPLYSLVAVQWTIRFTYDGYRGLHRFALVVASINVVWHIWGLLQHRVLLLAHPHLPWLAHTEAAEVAGSALLHGAPIHLLVTWFVLSGKAGRLSWILGAGAAWGLWIWALYRFGLYSGQIALPEAAMVALSIWLVNLVDRWFQTPRATGIR